MNAVASELDNIFQGLGLPPVWVPYVKVWNPKREAYDKIPHNGRNGLSTKEPTHWTPLLEALQTAQDNYGLNGVGLVMTGGITLGDLTLVGFDFDDVTPDFIPPFKTYAETSPSGNGVRMFAWVKTVWAKEHQDSTDTHPPHCDHCEIYIGTDARFLTVTFDVIQPEEIAPLSDEDLLLIESWGMHKFKDKPPMAAMPQISGGTPIDLDALEPGRNIEDRELIGKLLAGARQPEIDRSSAVRKLLVWMIDSVSPAFNQEDIFATLTQTPVLWLYLLDHREGNPEKAMQFANEELARAFHASVKGGMAALFADPHWKVADVADKTEPVSPDTETRDEYYIASFAERRKDRKPNRWQVKGRFRKGTINIIFGASGTYKSTTMTGLGVSIQCLPYWHDSLIENGGEGVLIIAAEDDEGVVDMVEAACIEYGIDPDKVSIYITHGGYDLSNPEVIKGIKAAIAAMPVPLSAIIVDTLNRNCGGLDENSASDMRTFLNRLDELRGDATVYVIHHNGHGDKKRERGSYAIRCNADSSVLCEYNEDTKLFTMEWEKLRSAPIPKPLTLKPKIIVVRQEADSTGALEDVTAVCMVMAGEAHRNARVDEFFRKYPELGAGKRRSYLWTLMARILNKPGETQTALAALCGVSQPTIHDTLIALQSRGLVTTKDEALQLTKAGVEAMNELSLDVAVALKAAGHDVGILARETSVKVSEDERNALLS